MNPKKWGILVLALLLLGVHNIAQPALYAMRTMDVPQAKNASKQELARFKKERYGPSMEWLDRLMYKGENAEYEVKLDFRVLSSMMMAGLASGFRSQVANLLWMKSDEYWHKGLPTRQIPLMEAVVTLDPQFIDAWSTAGWHWAYNIYADLPARPDLKDNAKALRQEQDKAIRIGLNYLDRGAAANPETYRLWFENAWTRGEKAGIYDARTIELMREARSKSDARTLESTLPGKDGKTPVTTKVEGLDIVGRNIGHVYEKIPEIDKALEQYRDLLRTNGGKGEKPSDAEMALLGEAGKYWGLYSAQYVDIVNFYKGSDPTTKAQIKKLVPEVDRMVAAQKMREVMAERESQATGAYVSITARYVPAWKLMKAGKLEEAERTIIGVMRADSKYHLQKLPALVRVMEMRGDAPQAIENTLKQIREYERDSSQEIGLHLLAKIYEKEGKFKQAYETWYRGRERNTLNFYARRNAQLLEDKHNFTPPEHIIKAIKASRKGGSPDAAPPPPNVPQYRQHEGHDHAGESAEEHAAHAES